MYVAVVAGCVLLYLIFVKMTQKAEYSEQLTVKEIVTEDVKKGSSSQLNDEEELHMLIDQSGAVEKEINGCLTQACFHKLRRIVFTHTFKHFIPMRDELMRRRILAFKAEKWEEY